MQDKSVMLNSSINPMTPRAKQYHDEVFSRAFKKRLSRPYLVYDDVIGKNKWNVFQKRKIVIKGTALRLVAAYDDINNSDEWR